MDDHLQHLRTVLQLLRDNHLYAKMSKCIFARTELEFLGHILSGDGLQVDPKKTSAVADWPVPRDISQLRSFLGMANYFRKFLHHFAQRTMPLTRLLRKVNAAVWHWTPDSQAAFDDIKHALTTAPSLALPVFFLLSFLFFGRSLTCQPYLPSQQYQRTAKGNLWDKGIHSTTHNGGSCFAMASDPYVT